ncbi:MAG: iron-containing alcohol dehydrogenase [Carboxylicivirga sp.]|jgi:alcohol dehydrogenase YqhD (iron-dependent ADH family)|nr:iron-containing alcohol dehydrogenase [Carboxylicivirga sp.]
MNNFEFFNPVKVVFGAGERHRLAGEMAKNYKKVGLVSYKELGFLSPLLSEVETQLEKEGIEVVKYFGIEENPEIKSILEAVNLFQDHQVEAVLAVGGGSVMDAAKAIAAGYYYEGNLWNMVYSRHDNVNAVPPEKALPIVTLPTLPATGSEMNQCAVVSNKDLKEKSYIWSTVLYPTVSFLDPELTVTLPAYQTACAAADTISHVLEIYVNGEEDSDLQHYFQEGVMKTVIDNIKVCLAEPSNISSRSHLMWAATCAINGFASPGDAWTPIHQVGHVLTSLFGVAHGASLSMLMPAWMKFMSAKRPAVYKRFAINVMSVDAIGKVEETIIKEGIEKFEQFLIEIGVPVKVSAANISETDFDAIVEGVRKVSFNNEDVLACNPNVTADDIKEILKLAL